jgi:hypothetical protein
MRRAWALLFLCGCGQAASDLVEEGATASDGLYGVKAGHLFISRSGSGVLFGTWQCPQAPGAFSYIILLDGARSDASPRVGQNAKSGNGATSSCSLKFKGAFLSVDQAVGPSGETLVLNGAAVDVTQGRVFLFDVRTGTLARLSAATPAFVSGQDARTTGEALLNALK